MDEEFFFPQNVRTSYRLWLLGPRHLKRLALAPVIALVVGFPLFRLSLFAAAIVAGLLAACYVVAFCLPILGDEQTLSDVGFEIQRHKRRQTVFANPKEVMRSGGVAELESET